MWWSIILTKLTVSGDLSSAGMAQTVSVQTLEHYCHPHPLLFLQAILLATSQSVKGFYLISEHHGSIP